MSNKNMTAVEWLVHKLKENACKYFEGAVPQTEILISNSTFELLINEAKAMEKEQIENAWDNGYDNCWGYKDDQWNTSKQYYKETYRGDTIQNE